MTVESHENVTVADVTGLMKRSVESLW